MKNSEKIVILFSGGLESSTMLELYKDRDVTALYISCGYRWEEAEMVSAKKVADLYPNAEFKVLHLNLGLETREGISSAAENVLPIRNMFLLTNAAMFALSNGASTLAMGIQGSAEYPDTSCEYLSGIENLVSIGSEAPFKIELPLYGKTKDEIISLLGKRIPKEMLFSCTEPVDGKRCRKCFKCLALDNIK